MACYVDGAESMTARSVPGHAPVAYTLFDCVDDLGRDCFVYVPFSVAVFSFVDIEVAPYSFGV